MSVANGAIVQGGRPALMMPIAATSQAICAHDGPDEPEMDPLRPIEDLRSLGPRFTAPDGALCSSTQTASSGMLSRC